MLDVLVSHLKDIQIATRVVIVVLSFLVGLTCFIALIGYVDSTSVIKKEQ